MPRGLYFFKREGEWPVILSAIMNTSTTCLWWPGGFSPIWKILCWCIGFRECCWHLQDVCRKWLNYDIEKWSRVIRMQTGLVVRKAISIWLCFYEWSLSFSCCFKDLLGFGGAFVCFLLDHFCECLHWGAQWLIWGLVKWVSYLQAPCFRSILENGMTRNTPKLIPASWDHFFPCSYFLTPLISTSSLAGPWWCSLQPVPSSCPAFLPSHPFLTLLKETDAFAVFAASERTGTVRQNGSVL